FQAEITKNEPGYNMNHSSYLYASDRYYADALYVLSHYPGYYLQGVRQALFSYLVPGPLKDHGEGVNYRYMRMIAPFETIYNKLILWQWMPRVKNWTFYFGNKNFETGSSLFWIVFFPFIMTWSGIELAGSIRRREFSETSFIITLFMWATAMYVTLISVFFGTWMGPGRYRFYIEPFFVCLVGMYLPGIVTKIAEKVKKEGTLVLNNMGPGSTAKAAVLSVGTFGIFFILLSAGGAVYPQNRPLPSEEEIGIAPVYNAMGKFFIERNDAGRAVKYFEKAETADPGAPAAAEHLEKAREMDPGGPTYVTGDTEYRLLKVLGIYQYLKGSIRISADLFEDAVALEPRDVKTLYRLGRIYKRTGDYKKAEEKFIKVDELMPGNPAVSEKLKELAEGKSDMVKTLNKKGSAAIRGKDFDKAISFFGKALELDPASSTTYNNLGYACYLNGDNEQAMKYLEEALKIDPDNAKARQNLEYIKNPAAARAA
ncbi:MAG: tetratricopeptide repeat protein, partial [Candidatus Omnitrophica bacterium]|nr:tetratricopeptide repeat protein [Candidatus Omnitrophota bacterium]